LVDINGTCNYVYICGDKYSLLVCYILVGLLIHLISFDVLIIDDDDNDNDIRRTLDSDLIVFSIFFPLSYIDDDDVYYLCHQH
jgi:hypothetical protein